MALAFEKKKKLRYGMDVGGVYWGDHGFKTSSSKFPIYHGTFALILKIATETAQSGEIFANGSSAFPNNLSHCWGPSWPKALVQGRGDVEGLDTQQDMARKGARTSTLALQSFWEERDSEWSH